MKKKIKKLKSISLVMLVFILFLPTNGTATSVDSKKVLITVPTKAIDDTTQEFLHKEIYKTELLHYLPLRVDVANSVIYLRDINVPNLITFLIETDSMVANNVKQIVIDLHSGGGGVLAMKMFIKQMDYLKDKGILVITRVRNRRICMSACVPIFLAGTQRVLQKDALFMLHPVKTAFYGVRNLKILKTHHSYNIIKKTMAKATLDFYYNYVSTICPNDSMFFKTMVYYGGEIYFNVNWLNKIGQCKNFFTKIQPGTIDEYRPNPESYKKVMVK